ncbi:hypothetical protein STRDD11_01711 [Streptococcus sp. DD11]|uniref:hypothetical protein n=1 Tax=Streptococcus sp. DD11 TaxID=1777879 RepID=UPI00079BF4F7|nr:hypothetical protein [Streptococcus sp. DD11]KXT83022.1 hypothetical protein STRDD11_01711 [Streptococcus sp. DD11]
MTTENDWFMRQIKRAANMIDSALRLKIRHLDLGQFEDEESRQLDRADYFQELLESERFEEAADFVQAQMKRLSFNQYEILADQFLIYLRSLNDPAKKRNGLTEVYLQKLEKQLKEFKW